MIPQLIIYVFFFSWVPVFFFSRVIFFHVVGTVMATVLGVALLFAGTAAAVRALARVRNAREG